MGTGSFLGDASKAVSITARRSLRSRSSALREGCSLAPTPNDPKDD